MQDSVGAPAADTSKTDIEKHISVLESEKTRLTKLFVAASDNLKKYDDKLKMAKEDFSKKYHQKKISKFRDDSVKILKLLTFMDNSIIRLKEELTQKNSSTTELPKQEESTTTETVFVEN